MPIDTDKLERVRQVGGKTIARCPACAEAGADAKGEHLVIFEDGRFGCVNHEGDREHRRRIWALVGTGKIDGGDLRSEPRFKRVTASEPTLIKRRVTAQSRAKLEALRESTKVKPTIPGPKPVAPEDEAPLDPELEESEEERIERESVKVEQIDGLDSLTRMFAQQAIRLLGAHVVDDPNRVPTLEEVPRGERGVAGFRRGRGVVERVVPWKKENAPRVTPEGWRLDGWRRDGLQIYRQQKPRARMANG